MKESLFDGKIRAMRRDRAARLGGDQFLARRAFDDILERLHTVRREFRSAILIGCTDLQWIAALERHCETVTAVEPGAVHAERTGAAHGDENDLSAANGCDLAVAIGTLDTADDLPAALQSLRTSMAPDGLLIGAIVGGDSLPALRAAMAAADRAAGAASPRVHPRIAASTLASLLSASGFSMPVIDVDNVHVAYSGLGSLVGDLRSMGCTNVLRARSKRPLLRPSAEAARDAFAALARPDGKTIEVFDILHFAAWTPAAIYR